MTLSFQKNSNFYKGKLGVVYSQPVGPFRVEIIEGAEYFLTNIVTKLFVDLPKAFT